jgi:DNA-binding transcriptional regulator YiaG
LSPSLTLSPHKRLARPYRIGKVLS